MAHKDYAILCLIGATERSCVRQMVNLELPTMRVRITVTSCWIPWVAVSRKSGRQIIINMRYGRMPGRISDITKTTGMISLDCGTTGRHPKGEALNGLVNLFRHNTCKIPCVVIFLFQSLRYWYIRMILIKVERRRVDLQINMFFGWLKPT